MKPSILHNNTQKALIRACLACLLLTSLFTSCKKEETAPRELITPDLIWDSLDKNATLAQQYLNSIYNFLPGGYNRIGGDFLDAATDDAIPSRNNTSVQYYTNGLVSTLNNPDAYWSNTYAGVRQANIFLANIGRVPAGAVNITVWKAEARFIRAFLYFELLKRYGGVPLVGDKIFELNDNLQLARNNFADCVSYIANECDSVKGKLTVEPIIDNQWGKIPRGAALALKCRVLLYAASPLFNGGGFESDPVKKALTGYTTNDPARWQKAIDAAEEFKAIGYYALQNDFGSVFTNKKNTEVILAKQTANNFDLETNNAPVGYNTPATPSLGYTSPVQNFVDSFPMDNGLSIFDPASGYNPAAPYTGRDKRLAATVFYNGMLWLKRNVQTFEGGLDKPGGTLTQTKTGYYLRKFMADFSNNTTYTNQSHNFILFRYAEILLSYAEALNEMDRVEDAVTQIKLIRARAGIKPGVNTRYGIAVGITKADMRKLIQNERRLELAFEEHRFWDVRRWKIAPQVLNGPLYGMKIVQDGVGNLTYTRVQVSTITFQNKLYHLPLPYPEVVKNANLLQNEGW